MNEKFHAIVEIPLNFHEFVKCHKISRAFWALALRIVRRHDFVMHR